MIIMYDIPEADELVKVRQTAASMIVDLLGSGLNSPVTVVGVEGSRLVASRAVSFDRIATLPREKWPTLVASRLAEEATALCEEASKKHRKDLARSQRSVGGHFDNLNGGSNRGVSYGASVFI